MRADLTDPERRRSRSHPVGRGAASSAGVLLALLTAPAALAAEPQPPAPGATAPSTTAAPPPPSTQPAASAAPAVTVPAAAASPPSSGAGAPDTSAQPPPGTSARASNPRRVSVRLRVLDPTVVDAPVRVEAIASSASAGEAVTYSWHWAARGSSTATSTSPVTTLVFRQAGPVVVGVLATDARGGQALAHLRIDVAAARNQGGAARSSSLVARAHKGADPTVAIKDFSFGPATVTIHAGETITWVNQGPSSHTATAQGTFDTGTLRTGQSASHVFSAPGTFNYICSIHPFMHATVVVLASASTNSGSESKPGSESKTSSEPSSSSEAKSGSQGSSTGTKAAGSAQSEAHSHGPELPFTGRNLLGELLLGLGLVLLGTLLLVKERRPTGTQCSEDRRASRLRFKGPPPP
jgi:plastocyanin